MEIILMFIGIIHLGLPLLYFIYMKKFLNRQWNLNIDYNFRPNLSIIIPTYNEKSFIYDKLSDLIRQDYPRDKMHVIVVDSDSTDGTRDLVNMWMVKNSNVNLMLINENDRKGKARALNLALKYSKGEIVVVTDADAFIGPNSLKVAAAMFSDKVVGAVTAIVEPVLPTNRENAKTKNSESNYRNYNNILRVAESKIHSTPIFNGQLMFFRKAYLLQIGGFPLDLGADDSCTASLTALAGYRAIAVPEVVVYEPMPKSVHGYLAMKARRGLHLVQTFRNIFNKLCEAPSGFKSVLAFETFLHLINPWFLLAFILFFLSSLIIEGFTPFKLIFLVTFGSILLVNRTRKPLVTWVVNQMVLMYSFLWSLRSHELCLKKIEK